MTDREIATKVAWSFIGQPYEPDRTQYKEKEDEGPRVTIHVDNFIGNQAWLNEFMRKINQYSRSGGYSEVFFNA